LPFKYNNFSEVAKAVRRNIVKCNIERPVVCVQGLGFVGAAMAIAVAKACDHKNNRYFNVIGVDLATKEGFEKTGAINNGILPFKCEDTKLLKALQEAHLSGNLIASADPEVLSLASTVLVDVNLDISLEGGKPRLLLEGFRHAIRTMGKFIPPGCLVIVESTVPPGTCEKIVAPILAASFEERGLPGNSFLLAHSYERVMPGRDYLDSIINFWRVYAGHSQEAADASEAFLSKIIDTVKYPLTRLSSTTASETAKVLENSYRANNIAFMEEWGRFAERAGIDIFEVVAAIRKRPTHANIRQPGFGVGGYCLTKDPLMAELAAKELLGLPDLHFPFCSLAITTNRVMPLVSLNQVQELLGGSLHNKSILLLGVSYRQEVGDTRNSPAQIFVENARARGAKVICHDPYVDYWVELEEKLPSEMPSPENMDVVVFAVPHEQYLQMDVIEWLGDYNPIIFDANNVLSREQCEDLKATGRKVASIGRGERL
jgi:UDP-N-acetyl-D-glucosamine dehydrogenase